MNASYEKTSAASGMIADYACRGADRPPQTAIESKLSGLKAIACSLDATVNELRDRFAPVCSARPMNSNAQASAKAVPSCPMDSDLGDLREHLNAIHEKLDSLLSSCQL